MKAWNVIKKSLLSKRNFGKRKDGGRWQRTACVLWRGGKKQTNKTKQEAMREKTGVGMACELK